jgi:signal transduction histidine kinase
MLNKLLLGLCLVLFSSSFSQNQQKIDSLKQVASKLPADTGLVNVNEKIAKLYLRLQLDSTKVYAQKMIDLSESLNYDKGLAMGHNWYGEVLLWQGDYTEALKHFKRTNQIFRKGGKSTLWAHSLEVIANAYSMTDKNDSALIYYQKALDYHENNNDSLSAAKVILNTGMVYSRKGDYTSALNYYYKAKLIFKTLNNEHWFISAERSIAILYGRQHRNDSAIVIFRRVISYQLKREDFFSLAESYTNLGVLYEGKKEFNKALEAQKKSMEYRKLVNDEYGVAITEMNIGSLYLNMKVFDSVLVYLDDSRRILKNNNNAHPLTYNLLLTGNYYLETGQLDKAETSYLKAYKISLDNNLLAMSKDLAAALSIVYEKKQDYQNALKYEKIFITQRDSISNEDNIRAQTIAKEEYKRKIQLFEKEKEIINEKQQKYFAIVIGIIIVLGLVFLIFYRRKLQKSKLLYVEQQNQIKIREAGLKIQQAERKRVANILHDNLAHVILNSQTRVKKIISKIEDKEINQKLVQLEENLEFMNKLAKVASYELEFSFVLDKNLVDQFAGYIARVEHSHSPNIVFNYSDKTQFDSLTDKVRINLFSVFQEMLGNAIKYAKAKTITINLFKDGEKTTLQVDDDGTGFNYEEVRHGQGFVNMKERAEKLNGKFSFESEIRFGTKLKFEV